MSNAPKYRTKAVEYEQLKQFDRAVASYARAIEENESAGEEVDVSLFNRVGDLTLRQGRVTEAVTYYERAVDHYVSNNLFDNAIALCNKILRNAPGRYSVYLSLGRICGRKGLRGDATKNFLEYATRMQQEGRLEEAMRALSEVAHLMPELTEVGRLVEEHAVRAGIELAPRHRHTPVLIEALTPENETTRGFSMSRDLVFLDIDYDNAPLLRATAPMPERKADAYKPAEERQSEVPALPDLITATVMPMLAVSGAAEEAGSRSIDGTPILQPYADTAEPVALLNDLEPTELSGIGLLSAEFQVQSDDQYPDPEVPTAVAAAEAALEASSRCVDLQHASNADPTNYVLRRRLAEALFEAGERDAAIIELGDALAGCEIAGTLAEALDIADELVRVAGLELAHHQKRLELAIRLGDQARLRDAYLDLADNLVRKAEDLRARAVYARVLEIDLWNERARSALGDAAPPPPAKPPTPGSDNSAVSLADWLRDDDDPSSTRLRMREPDVSGDEQDDFKSLLRHFKEGVARSLGEDDYESHYDLGVAYKEMGLLDDALGEFQMALRGRTNRLAAYEALGQCFIEQQTFKVAVTVLSRALHEPAVTDEQRVGVLYLLGYSCEGLQRFDEARGYFQRVYATDIHFRDVAQRLADLDRTVR